MLVRGGLLTLMPTLSREKSCVSRCPVWGPDKRAAGQDEAGTRPGRRLEEQAPLPRLPCMPPRRIDPPLVASEVDTLHGYLDYQRDTLRMKTDGLDEEQLARRHPPSTLTLGGLLKHAAFNEHWWFMRVLAGCDTDPDWVPDGAFDGDDDWELTSASENDSDELRRIFDASRAEADAAIDQALMKNGLDTVSVVTSRREAGQPFSLRWILLLMIGEYARHNGHADLLREAIDSVVGE